MTCLHATNRRWRTLVALALIPCLLFSTSCAVLTHGSRQGIPFDSEPQGAEVWVDGEFVGVTPVEVTLSRSQEHTVVVRLGAIEHEMVLETRSSQAVAYDLLPLAAGAGVTVAACAFSGAPVYEFDTPSWGEVQPNLYGEPYGPWDWNLPSVCEMVAIAGLGIGGGLSLIMYAIDGGTGAANELAPGEVLVSFDLTEEIVPQVEGGHHEKDQW